MPRYDFRSPRLFVDVPITAGREIALSRMQANYLLNVLRLKPGSPVLVFNGKDGEWRARLEAVAKRNTALVVDTQLRAQTAFTNIHFCFAPLKHARLDYMVQKAVELGAAALHPLMTRHTQAERVNLARMRSNVIEAAEQCGVLSVPEVAEPVALDRFLSIRDQARLLVFCDEDAEVADPLAVLEAHRSGSGTTPLDLVVGPEGGFAEEERALLLRAPNVARISLGPRILRADTAAVAALALVQAVLGDWH